LHDIGKIGIADAVLLKPGRLTESEMAEMRRHSEIGAAILEVNEAMADIAQIVRHHHERWDGRGYPDGLVGSSIPLGGRIIAVADAFNAMISDRIYRAALPLERAWAELRAHAGSQFDAEIVAVFEHVVDEQGNLRSLDPALERTLSSSAHISKVATEELHATVAATPVVHTLAAAAVASTEACPAAPAGEECAVAASGEGCEIVVPTDAPTRPSGARQFA
jgi:HD-GYP domain-containing protein (c-di-GMP phosphodiesterase class II)